MPSGQDATGSSMSQAMVPVPWMAQVPPGQLTYSSPSKVSLSSMKHLGRSWSQSASLSHSNPISGSAGSSQGGGGGASPSAGTSSTTVSSSTTSSTVTSSGTTSLSAGTSSTSVSSCWTSSASVSVMVSSSPPSPLHPASAGSRNRNKTNKNLIPLIAVLL
jgi:hypothetical protein